MTALLLAPLVVVLAFYGLFFAWLEREIHRPFDSVDEWCSRVDQELEERGL